MSSTNKTTNYNLSKFLGTDHFSFLTDYNGDMQKIDTALASNKALANALKGSVEQLGTDQESNVSNFEKTNKAIQSINESVSSLQNTQSDILVKENQHDTDISDLQKTVEELNKSDRAVQLVTSNVVNGTSTKYNPVIMYNANIGAISVVDGSIVASNLSNFSVVGDIDISNMLQKDRALINSKGISFECGYLPYDIRQTIDGVQVTSTTYVPLIFTIYTDGTEREAHFSLLPMKKVPSEVITDDGIAVLTYSTGKYMGHGLLMS